MSNVVLLGPQRLRPMLREAAEVVGAPSRIATITGGWQELELEDDELAQHLEDKTVNLQLYHRLESLRSEDEDLLRRLHERLDRLEHHRRHYRIRLAHALDAARELLRLPGDDEDLRAEQIAAIDMVRSIDDHHAAAVRRINDSLLRTEELAERPGIAHHRRELQTILDDCDAIAIAGGHVGRLLDQLIVFGLTDIIRERPVIAWSAGAMVLGTQVVLFHDSPPQGPGNAEVHGPGLGRYEGIVPLPHARRRLQLDDPIRVGLFARRFAPQRCVAMNEGARIVIDADRQETWDSRELLGDGQVVEMQSDRGAIA